ncbi:hypothetical protein IMZ68_07070 [Candidatus Bathyarchaeota archaeon]|nr:hypothetical protein [Candidatus Bathyarchaeota archaeon]
MENPFVSCDLVDADCESRYCFDGTFCPRVYADPKVFGSCPTHLEKLKAKEQS